MARIVWTEPALADLNDIAEYIALDKVAAARRLVQRVFSAVGRLEQFPESGRHLPELDESPCREVIVGPCRILYRYDGQRVIILYVMRGERELRNYIIDERLDASI
ncbi:type II toxin-antitoxin system RelE/ParE family toxin [Thiolapillus sp.]